MDYFARIAAILVFALGASQSVGAQTPPVDGRAPGNATAAQRKSPPAPTGNKPVARVTRRSIVHHYPLPYPEYYHGDETGGFRNPGGVGRYREYYPPGNQFQEGGDPVRVAKFDTGFGNRQEQLQSIQVGVARENAIMNHIDRYARPAFGVGYFGGFY
jgi:hypothetical protein